jgi:hypothetical protein
MKAHIAISDTPLGEKQILCEAVLTNPYPVLEVSGEILSVREMLSAYRGLCRLCKKDYFARPVEEKREYVYILAEGRSRTVTDQ